VLVSAAELDLRARRLDAARLRAEEGLRAAELVGRKSQEMLARSVLAGAALARGDREAARRHLDAAAGDLEPPLAVSARARAALLRARAATDEAARDVRAPST
jgi:hypothetical protein